MIQIHTQPSSARKWINKYRGKRPGFVCTLGFTDTCLIPGITAMCKTSLDCMHMAISDARVLLHGASDITLNPENTISPALISRAVISKLNIPLCIFNAGLPESCPSSVIDLEGHPAKCLTTASSLSVSLVEHLFNAGLEKGEQLFKDDKSEYIALSECVVGGTTTALAILCALGINAKGLVNSSHRHCNHDQKWQVVEQGLSKLTQPCSPFELVASVGDPMQIFTAGMAIVISRERGVILAGGTQMLAIYALARELAVMNKMHWNPEEIVIGTTKWVASDRTGGTIELAELVGDVPLLSANIEFINSRYPQLRLYEQGFIKEGAGAGAAAIISDLYGNWKSTDLMNAVESTLKQL
jgi:uncharacterized protein (TIGR00303 family)